MSYAMIIRGDIHFFAAIPAEPRKFRKGRKNSSTATYFVAWTCHGCARHPSLTMVVTRFQSLNSSRIFRRPTPPGPLPADRAPLPAGFARTEASSDELATILRETPISRYDPR